MQVCAPPSTLPNANILRAYDPNPPPPRGEAGLFYYERKVNEMCAYRISRLWNDQAARGGQIEIFFLVEVEGQPFRSNDGGVW